MALSQTENYPFVCELEDLCMHLAELLGIKTAKHCLIPLRSGELAYLSERFDRHKHEKISIEDFCQLAKKPSKQKYKSSSEQLTKIIKKYSSNPGDDQVRLLELLLYSFMIGNADMHLKNFSLITDDPKHIHLSPAYDLLSSRLLIPEKYDKDELALPLNGKKNNIKQKDWLSFCETMNIPQKVYYSLVENYSKKWNEITQLIQQAFISEDMKNELIALINNRLNQLK